MKKRFPELQIIGILKETEAGMKVADVICKHGISSATYYNSGKPSSMGCRLLMRMTQGT